MHQEQFAGNSCEINQNLVWGLNAIRKYSPSYGQINHAVNDAEPMWDWFPRGLRVRPDPAIIISQLILVFNQLAIQLHNVGILEQLSITAVSKWLQQQQLTFFPNWLDVPSMQTTRFLPVCWASGLDSGWHMQDVLLEFVIENKNLGICIFQLTKS